MKRFKMFLMGGLILLLLFSEMAYGAGWITKRLTITPGDSGSPKIAVNGSMVYVVWNDSTPGNDEIYFRKSIDGGVAWKAAKRLTNNAGFSTSPAIAVDGSNVYVVWADSTPGIYQIYFMKSADGGNHWQAARGLTINKTAKAGNPAIAVVGTNVYVVWHNDDTDIGGNSWIAFTKSADGGAHWQAVKTLSNTSLSVDSRNPAIAAADSGVYIVWEANTPGNNEIYFKKSTNWGATWQVLKRLTTNSGSSGSPAIAILGSTVYLAWGDGTPGNNEIYFMKSANKGAAWQPCLRLTNNTGYSTAPALAVMASSVYVVWSDNTPGNFEIYHRTSTNSGGGWQAVERLTKNSGSSGNPSIATGGSKIFVVWRDFTPGNYEIYLMHQKPVMNPISVISPTASTVWVKGETVKIKWQIVEGAAGQAQMVNADLIDQTGSVDTTASLQPIFSGALKSGQETESTSLTDLLVIDKVKIDLYNGTTLKMPIVKKTSAGAGTYSWKVPTSLEDGTKYKVRISISTDSKVYKESASFRISSTALPDLVVDSLTHSPASPTTLDQITISVQLKNTGSVPAGVSTLKVGTDTYRVPVLAAGATWRWSQIVGPLSIGGYTVTSTADVNGEVAESNETNNRKADGFTVHGLPDLVVSSLTHSPASPQATDIVTITVVVYNQGWATAGASTLSLRVSGEATPTTYSIPALLWRRDTATVTRTVGPLLAQDYQVTATADIHGAVAESDETNNVKTDSFTITAPDLVVSSLTGSITAAGGSFTAVVRNDGSGAAGASVLRMTLRKGTKTIASMDFNVPALASGVTHTQAYNITASIPSGTYTLTAYADATGVVAESNESNNTTFITRSR